MSETSYQRIYNIQTIDNVVHDNVAGGDGKEVITIVGHNYHTVLKMMEVYQKIVRCIH